MRGGGGKKRGEIGGEGEGMKIGEREKGMRVERRYSDYEGWK